MLQRGGLDLALCPIQMKSEREPELMRQKDEVEEMAAEWPARSANCAFGTRIKRQVAE